MPARRTQNLLSPKQVAQAIGVSESSLKRWCDRGLIPTVRTAGGHRRLPIQGVLDFLRKSPHPLVHPELLGLPARTNHEPQPLEEATAEYLQALLDADEDRCRRILFELYLAQHRLSVLADEVITPAFHRLGEYWAQGQVEVYQERLACEITRHVLNDLSRVVPLAISSAPVAIGGTPAGDCYNLPTRLAELVLRECGWQARSLGSNLPLTSLARAIAQRRPQLCWLSVSHIANRSEFLQDWGEFYRLAVAQGVTVIVGGRALTADVRHHMSFPFHGERLQDLEPFLGSLPQAQLSDVSGATG